ncbi:MAG: hypothetical protein ACRCX2_11280 [Paraclostridium sp.]
MGLNVAGVYNNISYSDFIFLSKENIDELQPVIPSHDNYYCELGIEDKSIPRISVAKNIDDCLTGLADKVMIGDVFRVYYVSASSEYIIHTNELQKNKLVPFVKFTGESWITIPVKPVYLHSIKVFGIEDSKVVRIKLTNKKDYLYRVIDRYKWEINNTDK